MTVAPGSTWAVTNGCSDAPDASGRIGHPAASETLRLVDLDGHADQGLLALLAAAAQPRLLAADEGLVDLHPAGEPFPTGPDQHRAQPVQHRPRRLVRADLQRPLQALRRDPVFLGGEQPARREPHGQRRARLSKIVPAVTDVRRGTTRTGTDRHPAATRPPARTPGTRTRPASAATPGSPGIRRRSRTTTGTRPPTSGSAHRPGDNPPGQPTPANCISRTRQTRAANSHPGQGTAARTRHDVGKTTKRELTLKAKRERAG